jgi:hypothetical protein
MMLFYWYVSIWIMISMKCAWAEHPKYSVALLPEERSLKVGDVVYCMMFGIVWPLILLFAITYLLTKSKATLWRPK